MQWIVHVNDTMQSDYPYELVAPIRASFAANFQPFRTPPEMLSMGVFEGKYCNDYTGDFPGNGWMRPSSTTSPTLP